MRETVADSNTPPPDPLPWPPLPGTPRLPRLVLPAKWQRRLDLVLHVVWGIAAGITIVRSARADEYVEVMYDAFRASCFVIGSGAIWGFHRWLVGRPVLRGLLVPAAFLAVLISVMITSWPLRITYACSQSTFDAVAARVRARETVNVPLRIGVFRILEVAADRNGNGVVCLWTDLTPSGYTGFVQCGPTRPPFNLWSHVALDDRWQFISED